MGAMLPFLKMHGAGNDFIVIDARTHPPALTPALIAALSDRHTGIGCDQFITLELPRDTGDVFMRIHNADGTESGTCGNATRCVAVLVAGETGRANVTVETRAGLLPATVMKGLVRVDMGPARTGWDEIPLAHQADTLRLPIQGAPAAASMGNPHATFFVANIAAEPIGTLGPELEHHPLFPHGANIGFAQILAPDRVRLRVWERGAGLTRACGSGACAAVVNAVRRGLTQRRVTTVLDGGTLEIEWREDGHVLMTGPAVTAFAGSVDLSTYTA
jgi:diaminopimelate epimerase